MKKTLKALLIFCFLTSIARAEVLLKSDSSWDGGAFYYPEGEAEITSIILRLTPDKTTPFHCHPVPTLGYILKGTVEVETDSGKTIILKEGESVVEVMRTVHRGRAIDGPVEIVVFYAGAKDIPVTVIPGE